MCPDLRVGSLTDSAPIILKGVSIRLSAETTAKEEAGTYPTSRLYGHVDYFLAGSDTPNICRKSQERQAGKLFGGVNRLNLSDHRLNILDKVHLLE